MINPVTPAELVVYGVVNLCVAVLSGVSGSGGGFIVTPLLIFLGLSPAQAVATGKINGITISIGSLGGMRRVPRHSKKLLFAIIFLTVVIGLIAPHVIVRIDANVFQRLIGLITLAMIPVIIISKVGHVDRVTSRHRKLVGLVVIALSLFLQAVFSGGLGTLVNLSLMAFMGMSAIEANVTKRVSQIVLNSVVLLGLLGSGLIVWQAALVGAISAAAGGFVGGKLAVKKGNRFVMITMVGLMFVSGVWLILG